MPEVPRNGTKSWRTIEIHIHQKERDEEIRRLEELSEMYVKIQEEPRVKEWKRKLLEDAMKHPRTQWLHL